MNLGEELKNLHKPEKVIREVTPGVFRVWNKLNDRAYYGTSMDVEKALKSIRVKLGCGRCSNKNLQEDWYLYGADCFEFKVLKEAKSEPEAKRFRNDLMQRTLAKNPWHLYNLGVALKS